LSWHTAATTIGLTLRGMSSLVLLRPMTQLDGHATMHAKTSCESWQAKHDSLPFHAASIWFHGGLPTPGVPDTHSSRVSHVTQYTLRLICLNQLLQTQEHRSPVINHPIFLSYRERRSTCSSKKTKKRNNRQLGDNNSPQYISRDIPHSSALLFL